ncbi:MAG: hypothetical protein RRB13_07700 [bacterium]|nr:hypothetical protein [bacterium]
MNRIILAFLALLLVQVPATQAIELYRLLDAQCEGPAGLIIYTDAQQIDLLGLDGRLNSIRREEVRHILVYNALENPISQVRLTGRLQSELREIHLKHRGGPAFTGWPIRFLEELVVYYDTNGKTSLVGIDQIVRIKAPVHLTAELAPTKAQPVSPRLGQGLSQCHDQEAPGPGEPLFPTRVISDQIRISQFFGAYQEGFTNLRRFQERTQFYARPFVFDEETKFGLPLTVPNSNEELPSFFPFYFQWSAGRPYSHQGLTVLGTKQVEWLPQVEPVFVMQTDLKSHFFNASFVGNPMALAAGSGFMVANRAFALDYYKKVVAKEAAVNESFNYLALSGIDYGPFSLAAGVYYPIYGLNAGGLFREVLATEATPIFRFMFQHPKSSFKLIWAKSHAEADEPDERQLRLNDSDAMISASLALDSESQLRAQLQRFSFDVFYLRSNYDYRWDPEITFGGAAILQQVDYREVFKEQDRSFKGNQIKTLMYARQRFGSYVVLTGQLNFFLRDYQLDFGSSSRFQENQYSLVGSIEFIL